MKAIAWIACLMFLLSAVRAAEVSIDLDQRRQTIDGFGTCLAWWKDQPYDNAKFREMYWKDLGCSILRMEFHPNALTSNGKLDGPTVVLGENIDLNVELFNFKAKGVKNFGQFAQAGKLLKIDEMKLIGSLWTPPHWMKTGARINPRDGQSCGGSLKMDEANLQQFAWYVAAYVKGFEKAYGVPVYAISIQNELRFNQDYNSCLYKPDEYATAVAVVAKEFARNNIKTKLMGPEDVGVGEPGNLSFIANQMSFIDAVCANDEAWKALEIFCIHGYAGDGASPLGAAGANWEIYWNKIKDFNKPSWQTETSGQNHNWRKEGKHGDRGALSIALSINDALTRGNVSAWVYWQAAMDASGRPNPQSLTAGADTTSKKYNAAKHFFRMIRPGAVRVDSRIQGPQTLHASAFIHEKNKTVTIQLINMGSSEEEATLKIVNHPGLTSLSAVRSTETENFEPQRGVMIENDTARVRLPASSILTLSGRIEAVEQRK